MGAAQVLFKEFVDVAVGPRLRAAGFRKRGSTFRLREGGTWGVVSFQKSHASTADEVIFTGNVGVVSERLRDPVYGWREGTPPGAWDCHLEFRLGELLPDRPPADYWWIVDADTDMDRLSADFARYLDAVVLFLRSLLSDEGLADHWLARLEAFQLGDPELGYLRALLERSGDAARLARFAAELARHETPEGEAERRRRHADADAVRRAAAAAVPERYIRTPLRDAPW